MALSFLQLAKDSTDLTTYTFAAQNLGTAASDRYIICTIQGQSSDGGARTISSLTIGGVSATQNAFTINTGTFVAIYAAAVPTGATGDVVATFSSTMGDANIALYRATGLTSTTATDSGTSTAKPGTTNLDVVAGGFAIGVSQDDAGTHTATWTNLTEQFDEQTANTNDMSGAMAEFVTTQTNLAVTCQWSSAPTRPVFAAASFEVTAASTGHNNLTLLGVS